MNSGRIRRLVLHSILRLLGCGVSLRVAAVLVARFARTYAAILLGHIESGVALALLELLCGHGAYRRLTGIEEYTSPVLNSTQGASLKEVMELSKPWELWEWYLDESQLLQVVPVRHNLRGILGTPQLEAQLHAVFTQICVKASSEGREIDHRDLQNFSRALHGYVKISILKPWKLPVALPADEELSWLKDNFGVLFPDPSHLDHQSFSKWAKCVIVHRCGVTLLEALQKAPLRERIEALRLKLKIETVIDIQVTFSGAAQDALLHLHTNELGKDCVTKAANEEKLRAVTMAENQASKTIVEFTVQLGNWTNDHASIGLSIDCDPRIVKGDFVMVQDVHARGAVPKWNLQNPNEAISKLDHIIEVDGVKGSAEKLVDLLRCRNPPPSSLRVQRLPNSVKKEMEPQVSKDGFHGIQEAQGGGVWVLDQGTVMWYKDLEDANFTMESSVASTAGASSQPPVQATSQDTALNPVAASPGGKLCAGGAMVARPVGGQVLGNVRGFSRESVSGGLHADKYRSNYMSQPAAAPSSVQNQERSPES